MNSSRAYQVLLVDLIDSLTINQIKEVLLPKDARAPYIEEMHRLAHDIDLLFKEKQVNATGRLLRLIVFLAQANLHVWHTKDRMQTEPGKYHELLEFAQDMNGLRNHVRNLLMEHFGEGEACNRRATFLKEDGDQWYSATLNALKSGDPTASGARYLTLTVEDFARLFGTTVDDIPSVCHEMIRERDFRYEKLDPVERDQVAAKVLKRIDSGEMWVSGPDKQDVWERGWSENLQEYEETHSLSALTPKFIGPNKVLRLDGDFTRPLDPDFEFNFVDILRHWAFRKYFKDIRTIYEFGCGSCQHLPVLAEIFPGKELHGLDWAVTSSKIIKKLAKEKGWNITDHLFDLYSPDERLALDSSCGVFTVGTMEQLGRNFEPFLQFLLRKRPAIVMHMETISELYNEEKLIDYLAIRYDRKRNYLEGYLDRLQELERKGKIEILKAHRLFFGNSYHDSYSLLVWRPKSYES